MQVPDLTIEQIHAARRRDNIRCWCIRAVMVGYVVLCVWTYVTLYHDDVVDTVEATVADLPAGVPVVIKRETH